MKNLGEEMPVEGQPRSPNRKFWVGAAALAAVALAGGMAINANSQAQAENKSESVQKDFADVAKADAETGDKVYVDSQAQVIKSLGEPGKLTVDGEKKSSFEITVHSVKVIDSCTLRGFGGQISPENGSFLLVDVSARLATSAANVVEEEIALMPLDSSVFGVSTGENKEVTYSLDTAASYSCELEGALDIAVGAGDEVRGKLVLDSPYSSGQIVYDPDKTGGWTWSY